MHLSSFEVVMKRPKSPNLAVPRNAVYHNWLSIGLLSTLLFTVILAAVTNRDSPRHQTNTDNAYAMRPE